MIFKSAKIVKRMSDVQWSTSNVLKSLYARNIKGRNITIRTKNNIFVLILHPYWEYILKAMTERVNMATPKKIYSSDLNFCLNI